MCLEKWKNYILIGAISCSVVFCLFCPILPPNPMINETMFSSIVGWKFNDGSIFAAFLTSITTILATHYTVDKNYKSIKLSLLPDNSTNLLIDLELKFNEYDSYKSDKKDEFILLTEILKYWKDYQKAFKILSPKFYNKFLKMTNSFLKENTVKLENHEEELPEETSDEDITSNEDMTSNEDFEKTSSNEIHYIEETEDKKNYGHENCKHILKALMVQITNIAFENDRCYFEFIDSKLITDNNIRDLGEDLEKYVQIKITTPYLKEYIKNISGKTTQELTEKQFEKLENEIKKLLDELRREIREYD